MIELIRTNSDNEDFIDLVRLLDKELAVRDGDDHAFYSQFNSIDAIKYTVVAFDNKIPFGCGAIKKFEPHTMEIKRIRMRTISMQYSFVENKLRTPTMRYAHPYWTVC